MNLTAQVKIYNDEEGKPVGIEIRGKPFPTNTLCLTNFRSDRPINYVVMEAK